MPIINSNQPGVLELKLNSRGIEEDYLGCLNRCFPNWGDRSTFNWAFKRQMHRCPAPDLLVLQGGGELVAGSAVNYRRISLSEGRSALAGIMTGSWTLPEVRGRGCFSRMIASSVEQVRHRGGEFLLAFVTAENPSRMQLQKAGAELHSTSYFKSEAHKVDGSQSAVTKLMRVEDNLGSVLTPLWENGRLRAHTIQYDSFEDWKDQVVCRPWKTIVYSDGDGSAAVVEQHNTSDRLLFWQSGGERAVSFLEKLKALSQIENKSLLAFSSTEAHAQLFRRAGFEERSGFLTSMRINSKQETLPTQIGLGAQNWLLQSGDRM